MLYEITENERYDCELQRFEFLSNKLTTYATYRRWHQRHDPSRWAQRQNHRQTRCSSSAVAWPILRIAHSCFALDSISSVGSRSARDGELRLIRRLLWNQKKIKHIPSTIHSIDLGFDFLFSRWHAATWHQLPLFPGPQATKTRFPLLTGCNLYTGLQGDDQKRMIEFAANKLKKDDECNTSLRDRKTRQLHQLVNRKRTARHELLVKLRRILRRQGLLTPYHHQSYVVTNDIPITILFLSTRMVEY